MDRSHITSASFDHSPLPLRQQLSILSDSPQIMSAFEVSVENSGIPCPPSPMPFPYAADVIC